MQTKKMRKRIFISVVAVMLVLAMGCGVWFYFTQRNVDPVFVYDFYNVGMTEYWGDAKESYGPVTMDKIQTVYLSGTQSITGVYVNVGDTVKKGDVLLSYDTTLNDLALERQRLSVEKLKLQLDDAEDRLTEIKAMRPMVIPEPTTEPEEPEKPDLGTALTEEYQITSNKIFDGSTQQRSIVCWIREDTSIDDSLFTALREKAEQLQINTGSFTPAAVTTIAKTADTTVPATTAENNQNNQTTTPSETTTPDTSSESTEASDPTQATDPTTAPTEPAPTTPEMTELNEFHVIFKVTEGNMSLGETLVWQGVIVTRDQQTNVYKFKFFDASDIEDRTVTKPQQTETTVPEIDYGSGYTSTQIAEMRSEQEKLIKQLQFDIRMEEADYKIMQTEASDGKVYAQVDGIVTSLLTEDEANLTQQPIVKVSGGGGFYVEGSVSELDKDNLVIGQEVTINDYNTGNVYIGTIEKISDYPTTSVGYYGSGNPNVSYYPFTVFIDGEADFQEYSYVNIQYAATDAEQSGIYLENPFLRTEQGKSYVYVQGTDGLLEKRYVTTGKSLWGSYTEILSGLTAEDLIAFPYGKNIKEGTETVVGDLSDLYDY